MKEDLHKAIEVLKKGGTILYPTDTIWGIGCDATNFVAVEKVFQIKQRHSGKSLIILLDHIGRLSQYVKEIPDVAYDLIEASNSPVTIIFSDAKNLASNLINEDGSIAIRIVNDEFCKQLIQGFRKPIVSTSANRSNKPSPSNYSDIDEQINRAVDYVVNWKQDDLNKNTPSSIIKLENNGVFKIIR